MTIIPAIDLKGGKCVRLRQGRAADETVYGDDPAAQAADWARQGAKTLHVVDLDGAFDGAPRHLAEIAAIVAAFGGEVEAGGGIRTADDLAAVVDAGASRAILGSAALEDPEFLSAALELYGERIAVGIDARGGLVQTRGWVETTATRATDLAAAVSRMGVSRIIYTDTATDGMLAGPNTAQLAAICDAAPGARVTASGGIASAADVAALLALGRANLDSAIVGKALYDGRVSFAALAAAAAGAR